MPAVAICVMAACSATADAGSRHTAGPELVRATAATPPSTSPLTAPRPTVPQFDQVVLTPDGGDGYQVQSGWGRVSVSAPPANTGGNLRAIYLPRRAPETVDQQVCATWSGEVGDEAQEGLALRVRVGGPGGGQAITITKNVWAYAGWFLNVHLWSGGSTWERFQLAQLDLGWAAVVQDRIVGLPWRVCARVRGADLAVKLWAVGQGEPGWDDPVRVAHATIPAAWQNPGRAGWYAGHLRPGEFVLYDQIDAAAAG